MLYRCYDPKSNRFYRYGALGIKVCEMLRASPVNLIALIGQRPGGTTLDRRNNEGHYSCGQCAECLSNGWPLNVRWATATEQNRNSSSNVNITLDGRTMCAKAWAEELGIPLPTVLYRFARGLDIRHHPKRKGRVLEIAGRRKNMMEWAQEYGLAYNTFHYRFTHGQIPEAREVL